MHCASAKIRTMRASAFFSTALLVTACGTPDSNDGGVDAAQEGCSGSSNIVCCENCLSDVVRRAECVGGAWSCPAGSVTEGMCSCKTSPFCMLPKPLACVPCSDGGTWGACAQDASTE